MATLQNEVQALKSFIFAYLFLATISTQSLGVYFYWIIQHRYNICTKTMLNTASIAVVLMMIYGFVGIWTQAIGFHNHWEFWLSQVYLGFFVSPWYNYSQTMVHPLFPIIFCDIDKIVR